MMKKHISFAILMSCLGTFAFAQTEAQQELKTYMDNGLVKWTSQDGKLSFRVGARVSMDGAYYKDDFTDRSSGVRFSEARLRVFSRISNSLDFKFDVDLVNKEARLKDVYLRWHTNQNGFLKVGNFAEPFSAENIQSTFDDHFINKSATTSVFGTGRALGISYRYYHPYFWGEAGVFSQKYDSNWGNGDMGYGVSTRLLGRYQTDDFHIHAGGSLNYRRPDANGFAGGSDDFNRSVTMTSNLESTMDKTAFIGSPIANAKNVFKYGFELMASYKQFYVSGEYVKSEVYRERDWNSMYNGIQGTLMATMAPNMDAMKKLYGGDPTVFMGGYSVQAGWKILGGNYTYNKVDALMARAGKGALELVLRYNRTNLDDIIPGSYYYGGKYYNSAMMAAFGLVNGSYAGGQVDSFTAGVNYYFTDNVLIKVNYGFQKLDNPIKFAFDKNLHSFQARLAFEF